MRVRAEGVSCAIGGRQIVQDVHLEAPSGACVGVIGPNGSGKTTLLRCLCRLTAPTSGRVLYGDHPLAEMSVPQVARTVAVVAQHNQYAFDVTVRDLVLLGRAPYKRLMERDTAADHEIVRQALSSVGLEAFADREYSSLSGGEQQRVVVARAIAQQTPCLLLDEPTNHLDVHQQWEILEVVRSLPATTVAVFHDLNLASHFCDLVYVLDAGRVVASGPTAEVLTAELIRRVFRVEAEILYDGVGAPVIAYRGVAVGAVG
ncbi:iron complex transport system ATP-binding protein [Austwickia chelonae]|uniref:Putative ABC transporter ATP-binding protein n=1 Tax=Austwickia chelonae NBRC 105200 TaxID=1184607 RepID=K6W9E1_9MICO|nr:ABC transporter ATP-binding protein [Austwickia chelonae]GAB78467.1 putative ABC transporter ATP-binding protein [Austwickia chelonae NBRC 105200]SEW39860.1 iron complex transport system ATP-binding protein [Austwickia chelonae]